MYARPLAVVARRVHTTRLLAAQNVGGPTLTDRLKEGFEIVKEHVKAAGKNQKQAMQDIGTGRADAGKVLPEHMKEAKRDMGQWGRELKQTATGDKLPGEAKVRDLPPMSNQQESIPDNVTARPTSQGQKGKLESQK